MDAEHQLIVVVWRDGRITPLLVQSWRVYGEFIGFTHGTGTDVRRRADIIDVFD